MTSMELANEDKMEVIVLTGLVAICKRLSENSTVPNELQAKARQYVEQYNLLAPYRDRSTTAEHAQGEELLVRIARFLPRVLEVDEREEPEPEKDHVA